MKQDVWVGRRILLHQDPVIRFQGVLGRLHAWWCGIVVVVNARKTRFYLQHVLAHDAALAGDQSTPQRIVVAKLKADRPEAFPVDELQDAVALDVADRHLHGRPIQRVDAFPEAEKALALPVIVIQCRGGKRDRGR